jgi:hypothetical protein
LRLRRRRATNECDAGADVGTRLTFRYRISRWDLASVIYRRLGVSKWKPPVFATARLLWLCELAVMSAVPGVSLGRRTAVDHVDLAVRGSVVTVTAECTARQGDHWWDWHVEVHDEVHEVGVEPERLAWCTLRFFADIDRQRYRRRLASKLAVRPTRVTCWLGILDALAILRVVVTPVPVAYAAWQHDWVLMLTAGGVLIVGWLVALTGLPLAIRDWVTVRPLKEKNLPKPRGSVDLGCERGQREQHPRRGTVLPALRGPQGPPEQ